MRSYLSSRPLGRALFCSILALTVATLAPIALAGTSDDEPEAASDSSDNQSEQDAAPAPSTNTPAPAGNPATAPKQAAPAKAADGEKHVAPTDTPDEFGRRAQQVLKAEKINDKPHPLQAQYPDYNVVVCEAGCGPGGKIVYKEKKGLRTPIDTAEMVPSAARAGGDVPASSSNILCVAGCGDSKKVYRGVERLAGSEARAPAPKTAAVASPEAAPQSTTPAPRVSALADAKSGKWITTVAPVAPAAAGDAASAFEPRVKKVKQVSGSGEWLAKINSERTANAAETHVAAATAAPVASSAAKVTLAPAAQAPQAKPAAAMPATKTAEASPAVASPAPSAAKVATPPAAPAAQAADTKPAVATPAIKTAETSPVFASPAPIAGKATTPPAAPAVQATDTKPADASPAVKTVEVSPATASPAPSAAKVASPPAVPVAQVADAKPVVAVTAAKTSEATPSSAASPAAIGIKIAMPSGPPASPASETKPATAVPATSAAQTPAAPQAATRVAEAKPTAADIAPRASAPAEKVISVPSDDTEMTAAIAKARAGLSDFWKAHDKPGAGEKDFALKVAVTEKGQTEHFWLIDVVRKDGKLSGTINNDPQFVQSVKPGQRYEFTAEAVSDWLYMRNGRMVGNETMRPLLKRMPKEQAASYKAMYEKP